MTLTRAQLEDQFAEYQTRLNGLRTYVKELRETAEKHGTDEGLLQEDLHEAEHNVLYYESELGRIKKELGGAPSAGGGAGGGGGPLVPHLGKQGVGALALVSLGFAAGVVVGKLLDTRKGE
jgi:hypothetical protein